MHKKIQFTSHLYSPWSVTEVMVELEPKAALKCFMAASVTLGRPVWVCSNHYEPTRSATHPTPTP